MFEANEMYTVPMYKCGLKKGKTLHKSKHLELSILYSSSLIQFTFCCFALTNDST